MSLRGLVSHDIISKQPMTRDDAAAEALADALDARDATEAFDASSSSGSGGSGGSSNSLSGAKRKRDDHTAWLAAAASLRGDTIDMPDDGDVVASADFDDDDDGDDDDDRDDNSAVASGGGSCGSAEADESGGDGNSTSASSVLAGGESFPSMFFSWDELDQYIHEFGANTYQVFRKRTSVTAAMRNSAIVKRIEARKGTRSFRSRPELIPEGWRFYAKTYVCTHGLKSNPRGEGLRTHSSIRDTGCTAKIHATLKFQPAERFFYVRARVTGSHNHPIGKDQYYSYAENRRITDPAVLRDIDDMSARGEFPKVILAHIAKRMRETTGEECVYKLKDIRNIIMRLKTERKELLATQGPGAAAAPGSIAGAASSSVATTAAMAPVGTAAPVALAAREAAQTAVGTRYLAQSPVATRTDHRDAGSADTSSADSESAGVSLVRLEILLDTSYTYSQAHREIERVVIGATEMVPKTISGFKFEVVPLAPDAARAEDVTFVLPKHALAGCEAGVVEYCRAHGLLPHAVGVTLPVKSPGPHRAFRTATLSSRQLLAMKRFYLARHHIAEARKSIEWVRAARFSAYPSAPFDEFASYNKDLFVHALELMPLTRVVVRGSCGSSAGGAPLGFTDTIYAPGLLKFASDANIDAECVKAVLLNLHARFHARASFVSPSFAFEPEPRERSNKASAYGAFKTPRDLVAGLSQLQSSRWGGFVLDCTKHICYLCAPSALEFDELRESVAELLRGARVTAAFESASSAPASAAAHDSGVLALLFVECMLRNATWGDSPIDSFAYFRVRFLMQAIKVVNRQDVHDIAW